MAGAVLAASLVWLTVGSAAPLRVASFNIQGGLAAPGNPGFEDPADVLARIGADVIGLQELDNDAADLRSLGNRLGLPERVYQASNSMQVGLLSRYRISQTNWVFVTNQMTRPVLLARVDMPGVERDPWVAVVHLKCCNTNTSDQFTRATELYYLRKEISQLTTPADPIIIMGDFNMVATNDMTYTSGPEGVSPFPAPADANGYFVAEGIFKLDARHAGGSGESWTWRSNGTFTNSALDHIMVNRAVRVRGAVAEIYHAEKDAAGIAGLPKPGDPLAARLTNASDHLPVFADLDIDDGTSYSPANFRMDGLPESSGYMVSSEGITLRVAVRGTRLYVATQSSANQPGGNDHHILVSDSVLASAASPAPWAKRGLTALPEGRPFLAAEASNDYAGWFNAPNPTGLRKWATASGVLEGSIDLVSQFGTVPEFVYVSAVAYQTSDASSTDPSLGRVINQVPGATVADDFITPDEFLRIPVRSVTDSAADGRFDVVVPGRGFAAEFIPPAFDLQPGVRWKTVPGRSYRLWRSSDLSTGRWQDSGTFLAGPSQWEAFVPEANDGAKHRFFRIELIGENN
jgi:endonuclease/exonuclease/phosphatase family metal-dependent hydrolase